MNEQPRPFPRRDASHFYSKGIAAAHDEWMRFGCREPYAHTAPSTNRGASGSWVSGWLAGYRDRWALLCREAADSARARGEGV